MFNFMKKKQKIFCISMQRNGTTSVGQFFQFFGYKVADNSVSQKNQWGYLHYLGDFEKIFNSGDFKNNSIFEDGPWFFPEFYKQLYFRFNNSKFILFKRDPEKWFASMLSHSNGKSLGRTYVHAKIYRRERELFDIWNNENMDKDMNGLDLKNLKEHYIDVYNRHNFEAEQFFKKHAPNSLFICDLEDSSKWINLGRFCGISVPESFDVHVNKSK